MREIEHVRQKEPYGCGVACVAMIAGVPYDDVRALLGDWWSGRSSGMSHHVLFELLFHFGFAVQNFFRENQLRYQPRKPWPPDPTPAPICVALTITAQGGHFVVWLEDGTVLDPLREGTRTLADYEEVWQVVGVYEVSADADPRSQS